VDPARRCPSPRRCFLLQGRQTPGEAPARDRATVSALLPCRRSRWADMIGHDPAAARSVQTSGDRLLDQIPPATRALLMANAIAFFVFAWLGPGASADFMLWPWGEFAAQDP